MKTRVIAVSCGIKISAAHHLVLSQYTHLTDGRTDRQNCDSNTVCCITCSRMVKIIPTGKYTTLLAADPKSAGGRETPLPTLTPPSTLMPSGISVSAPCFASHTKSWQLHGTDCIIIYYQPVNFSQLLSQILHHITVRSEMRYCLYFLADNVGRHWQKIRRYPSNLFDGLQFSLCKSVGRFKLQDPLVVIPCTAVVLEGDTCRRTSTECLHIHRVSCYGLGTIQLSRSVSDMHRSWHYMCIDTKLDFVSK